MKRFFLFGILIMMFGAPRSEEGNYHWLKNKEINDVAKPDQYRSSILRIGLPGVSTTLTILKKELKAGLQSMTGVKIEEQKTAANRNMVIGTAQDFGLIKSLQVCNPSFVDAAEKMLQPFLFFKFFQEYPYQKIMRLLLKVLNIINH